MKSYLMAEAIEHEMKLEQLGAKVVQITSKLCYVHFVVDGVEIEYAYNINAKGKYFLERIKPYPLPVRAFEDETKLVEIIEIDLEQFKQASESKHMVKFLQIGQSFHETAKRFEDLFLYYNVPEETLKEVFDDLLKINTAIDTCRDSAPKIYFKKEPENL